MGDLHIDFAGLGTGESVSVRGSVHEAREKIMNLMKENIMPFRVIASRKHHQQRHKAPLLPIDVLLVSRQCSCSQARHAQQAVSCGLRRISVGGLDLLGRTW